MKTHLSLGLTSVLLFTGCGTLPLPGGSTPTARPTPQTITASGNRIYVNSRSAEFYGNGDVTLNLSNTPDTTITWKISDGEVIAQENGTTALIPYSTLNKQTLTGVNPITVSALDDQGSVIATKDLYIDDHAPSISVPGSTILTLNGNTVTFSASDVGGSGMSTMTVTCTQDDITITNCGTIDSTDYTVSFKQPDLIGKFAVGTVVVTLDASDRVGNTTTQQTTLTLQGANTQGVIKPTGTYIDDPRGIRFYGGGEISLTLSSTLVPADNITWSSSRGEVNGSGYTAIIPYSAKNQNALRGGQVSFTAKDSTNGQTVASITLNIDDFAPQAVSTGTENPGVLALETYTNTSGTGISIPHLINTENYYGNGVKFQMQYIDKDENGNDASGLIPIQLDVWRNSILMKSDFTQTDQLVEGNGYILRANSIADRLGNRVTADSLDLANFMYDKSKPVISYASDFGLVLKATTTDANGNTTQQNPIAFTASDAVLDDKSAGSGIASLSATCTQGSKVLTPCGGKDSTTITLLNDMMKAQGFTAGPFTITLKAVDVVGSTLASDNPDLANHVTTTTYTVNLQ